MSGNVRPPDASLLDDRDQGRELPTARREGTWSPAAPKHDDPAAEEVAATVTEAAAGVISEPVDNYQAAAYLVKVVQAEHCG